MQTRTEYQSIAELPESILRDREFGPAYWLLTSPLFADKGIIIRPAGRYIDWEQVFDRAAMWSHGEKMLVAVAFNLWNGTHDMTDWLGGDSGDLLSPYAWRGTLSPEHYKRILDAIEGW